MLRKSLFIFCCMCMFCTTYAAHTSQEAYHKLMSLTKMFSSSAPYSCNAIVQVVYDDAEHQLRDTSRLIYKGGITYYKSKVVERIEATEGVLIINHELKTATFEVSDSIKNILQGELNIETDEEFEAMLDSNYEEKDQEAFKSYLLNDCKMVWQSSKGTEEISFKANKDNSAMLLSMKIKFTNEKVLYYEYTNREVYSNDWNGTNRYRLVTTIYNDFNYSNVPNIPVKLSDYLGLSGWTVKLKKYTDYKFSLL